MKFMEKMQSRQLTDRKLPSFVGLKTTGHLSPEAGAWPNTFICVHGSIRGTLETSLCLLVLWLNEEFESTWSCPTIWYYSNWSLVQEWAYLIRLCVVGWCAFICAFGCVDKLTGLTQLRKCRWSPTVWLPVLSHILNVWCMCVHVCVYTHTCIFYLKVCCCGVMVVWRHSKQHKTVW